MELQMVTALGICSMLFCFNSRTVVKTTNGRIRGYVIETRDGKEAFGFSGVPYAKPPIGGLRFQDPQPAESWDGLRNTNKFGSPCPQYVHYFSPLNKFTFGNEDCLYLSVYTPSLSKNLPVVVYFHEGGFFFGSGEIGHNPSYLMDENVIVVTVNYRLDALGFLTLEDEVLPGNMGLKDQVMAIKWIHENIKNFGGDPDELTIMGLSAGGASVHYHMKSPLSQGLFKRAISLSGTSHSPWAWIRPGVGRSRTLKVAKLLGCPTDDSKKILECLRTIDAFELVNIRRKLQVPTFADPLTLFTPVIDNSSRMPFLPDDPWRLKNSPVPWLTGFAKYDGLIRSGEFVKRTSDYQIFNKYSDAMIPITMMFNDTSAEPVKVARKIKTFYLGNKPFNEENFVEITNMFTDSWFFWPFISAVRRHTGPVFTYYLDFLGKRSVAEIFASKPDIRSATHSDDMLYIWNFNFAIEPLSGRDLNFSKTLVKLLTNFIKTGKPTTEKMNITWNEWSPKENYLHMTNESFIQRQYLLSKTEKLWSSLKLRNAVQ